MSVKILNEIVQFSCKSVYTIYRPHLNNDNAFGSVIGIGYWQWQTTRSVSPSRLFLYRRQHGRLAIPANVLIPESRWLESVSVWNICYRIKEFINTTAQIHTKNNFQYVISITSATKAYENEFKKETKRRPRRLFFSLQCHFSSLEEKKSYDWQ